MLIWGMRHWMAAMLQTRPVPASVMRSFETVGGTQAFRSMVAMVLLAARDADRPLLIHPPCSGELSIDEETIARALAAFAEKSFAAARLHLRVLIGGEPSAALERHALIVADCFRSAGLRAAFGKPAEWSALASSG